VICSKVDDMIKKRKLLFILGIALALRLGLLAGGLANRRGMFTPDSQGYVKLSRNLVGTGRFEQAGQAEIFRTPGYPFFLVPWRLAGENWLIATGLAQVALDVSLVYLTYVLGCALCSETVGLWGAAFQAVSAAAMVSSVRILSDGLFAFLLTLSILLAVHHLRTRRLWSVPAAAAVAAAACYVRPVGVLFAALLLFVILLSSGNRWKRAGMFAAIMVLAIGPWILRNGLTAGYWGFSAIHSQVVFDCLAPSVLAEEEGISFSEARGRIKARLAGCYDSPAATQAELARRRLTVAWPFICSRPVRYAFVHLRGSLGTWMPAATDVLEVLGLTTGGRGTVEVLRRRGLWAAVENYFGRRMWAIGLCAPLVLILAAKYAAAAAAVIRCVRLRMGAARWLVLLTIALLAVIPGPAGHPRYRVPVVPLLSVVAAAGVIRPGGAIRRKEGG